jgi:hypothetical protein
MVTVEVRVVKLRAFRIGGAVLDTQYFHGRRDHTPADEFSGASTSSA